jgi:hypothetical protein
MDLDDYRSQIEPATVWFFDAKNEPVNWGGVEPNAYRQATGYLAPILIRQAESTMSG